MKECLKDASSDQIRFIVHYLGLTQPLSLLAFWPWLANLSKKENNRCRTKASLQYQDSDTATKVLVLLCIDEFSLKVAQSTTF